MVQSITITEFTTFTDTFKAISEAIEDGVEVMGYSPWGCIDLISLSTGEKSKCYGFIYVDKHDDGSGTLERKKKNHSSGMKKLLQQMVRNFNSIFNRFIKGY